jgi:hypothetical protein
MTEKVRMSLVGQDGNAFFLMGAFQREARMQGWTSEEIEKVIHECKSGDYNHLLSTLMDNIEEPEDEEDEYEEDSDY